MSTSTLTGSMLVHRTRARILVKLLSFLTLVLFSNWSFGQAIQFDQAQNDIGPNFNITWTNGILNNTQTTYYEGLATPQRLFLSGLTPGTHTLKIRHLAEASNSHAYDFLVSWPQALSTALDIGGVTTGPLSGRTNELQLLYDLQLSGAPPEFLGADSVKFNHAAFNGSNPNYVSDSYMPATFGDPTGTVPSVDGVLSCWSGTYGNPFFEMVGTASITAFSVTAEAGYTANYKIYTITWTSNSDKILLLFAGHPAMGLAYPATCGYGTDQGAGSVNGGNYHIKLDYLDGSIGERDNQIMASAFEVPPPTCSLSPGTAVCVGAQAVTVTYTGTNAGGATVTFYFVNNTANAKFSGSTVSTAGSCNSNNVQVQADGSGTATVTVVPNGSDFTTGSFLVGACVTTDGGSATCQQTSGTTVTAATATATANPVNIIITSAAHNSVITASAALNGTTNNSLFNFAWTADAPYTFATVGTVTYVQLAAPPNTVVGTVTGTTTSTLTFTAALAAVGGTYTFRVTATQIAAPNCSATAFANVQVSGTLSCPIVTTAPVCIGATVTYTASVPPSSDETWAWSINPSGGGTINGPTNGQSVNVTWTTAGTYSLTLTKTYANTEISPTVCEYSVVVNPLPVCNITGGTNAICTGGSTTWGGPNGMTTYAWQLPGGTTASTQTITVSTAGTYTLTITNAGGCTSTCTRTLTVNPNPDCSITGGTNAICAGGSTTWGGPNGMTTYAWQLPGGTTASTQTITVSTAGTYTLTITNSSGCTSTCTRTLTVNPNPDCSITGGTNAICAGGSTTWGGPNGMTTYLWQRPGGTTASTQTITVSTAGTYTLTVTNSSGCTSTCTRTLTVNPNPDCSITGGTNAICAGGSTTWGGPNGMTTYAWQLPGGTTASTQTITVSTAGTYTLTITNSSGCTSTCTRTLTVNPNPDCSITGGTNAICAGGSTTWGGPNGMTTYLWQRPGGATASTQTITVSTAGTYTLTVTNSSGCTSTCTRTLTVNPLPDCSITGGSSALCQGGSTTWGGPNGMTTYAWQFPGGATASTQTVTVSLAGTYTLTVTNSNGCTSTCTRVLSVNTPPDCTISGGTNAICAGGSTTWGGPNGMTTYAWQLPGGTTASTQTITVSTAGTYTLTVTNSSGCTNTCTRTLTVNPNPDCSITGGTNAICAGGSTTWGGPNGMTTYLWQRPGGTTASTQTITVSTAGTYTLTVTNSSGCTSTCTRTLTVNPNPDCSITGGTNAICAGSSTTWGGPNGMTTYAWQLPGGTTASTQTITVSTAGTYTLTVTNSSGCTSTCTRTLTVNPNPNCTITGGESAICSGNTTTWGGPDDMANYAWLLPGGATASTQTITVSTAGTYTLTVTNRSGCESTCTRTLTVNECATNCSYTQGYYGGKGKSCDGGWTASSPQEMIKHLLDAGGDLVVGVLGVRSVTIPDSWDGANALHDVMPGGGTAKQLPDYNCLITDNTCFTASRYLKNGRINNVLLSQTITLGLNMRLKAGSLAGFTLPAGTFTTLALSSCENDATPVWFTDQSFTIPESVTGYLGAGATVQQLFDLANQTLAYGPQTANGYTPSFSEVNQAVDAINRGFDGCRTIGSTPPEMYVSGRRAPGVVDQMTTDNLSVQAYPNPFNDVVKFNIHSNVSGNAQLEVYNSLGQKMATIFNGTVIANRNQVVEYKVPASAPQNLLYILRLGSEQVSGKLLRVNR